MTEEEFSSLMKDGNNLVKGTRHSILDGAALTLLMLSGIIGIIMLLLGYTHLMFYLMPFVALSIPFVECIIKTAKIINYQHQIKKIMHSAEIVFDIINSNHKHKEGEQ